MRRKIPLVSRQRLPLLNISIFIVAATSGYVAYFIHGIPSSLTLGIAFTVILVLYIYLLEQRSRQR